jgi:branched-chain amino acid transport system permease protein
LGFGFIPALLSSIVVAGALGTGFILLIGRVRGDYLVVVTLGLQLVFISVLINLKSFTGGNVGLMGIPRPKLFDYQFDSPLSYALLALIICAVIVGVAWWISRSLFGRSLKALREDEVGSQALGKNVFKYKVTTFAISAALAGVVGSLYAPYQQFINPYSFGLWESIITLVIVIVGGAGNLWGSVVGAVILVTLPEVLRFVPITSGATAQIRELIFGLALLLVVFFRPQGLFGEYSFGAVVDRKKTEEPGQRKMTAFEYRSLIDPEKNRDKGTLISDIGNPILEVSNLSKSFSGIRAVERVSFRIPPGKVTGIIGPNGAGKRLPAWVSGGPFKSLGFSDDYL